MSHLMSVSGDDARTLIKFLLEARGGVWETNHWIYPPSGGRCAAPRVPAPLSAFGGDSQYWMVSGDPEAVRATLRAMPRDQIAVGAHGFIHARFGDEYRQIKTLESFLRLIGLA